MIDIERVSVGKAELRGAVNEQLGTPRPAARRVHELLDEGTPASDSPALKLDTSAMDTPVRESPGPDASPAVGTQWADETSASPMTRLDATPAAE